MKSIRRTPALLATLLATASVIVFALAAPASAHSTGPSQGWFPGFGGFRGWAAPQKTGPGGVSILRDSRPLISLALQHRTGLKLTLDQAEELETIRDAFARRYRRERVELLEMREDLRKSLREANIDLADAGKRIRAIEAKRAALRLARLQAIEKGKAVLTPDQLTKLLGLLKRGSYPAQRRNPGGWNLPGMQFRYGPWGGPHHREQPHPGDAPGGKKTPEQKKKDF
jgi:Spy/CpxP family protein refolding chaperone